MQPTMENPSLIIATLVLHHESNHHTEIIFTTRVVDLWLLFNLLALFIITSFFFIFPINQSNSGTQVDDIVVGLLNILLRFTTMRICCSVFGQVVPGVSSCDWALRQKWNGASRDKYRQSKAGLVNDPQFSSQSSAMAVGGDHRQMRCFIILNTFPSLPTRHRQLSATFGTRYSWSQTGDQFHFFRSEN